MRTISIIKTIWQHIKLVILFLFYYVGCVWHGITTQRKSYDFNRWLQSPEKVKKDTMRFIALSIIIGSVILFGWFWTFIGSIFLALINTIVLIYLAMRKNGRTKE